MFKHASAVDVIEFGARICCKLYNDNLTIQDMAV